MPRAKYQKKNDSRFVIIARFEDFEKTLAKAKVVIRGWILRQSDQADKRFIRRNWLPRKRTLYILAVQAVVVLGCVSISYLWVYWGEPSVPSGWRRVQVGEVYFSVPNNLRIGNSSRIPSWLPTFSGENMLLIVYESSQGLSASSLEQGFREENIVIDGREAKLTLFQESPIQEHLVTSSGSLTYVAVVQIRKNGLFNSDVTSLSAYCLTEQDQELAMTIFRSIRIRRSIWSYLEPRPTVLVSIARH